jgi:hypothetical protein
MFTSATIAVNNSIAKGVIPSSALTKINMVIDVLVVEDIL